LSIVNRILPTYQAKLLKNSFFVNSIRAAKQLSSNLCDLKSDKNACVDIEMGVFYLFL